MEKVIQKYSPQTDGPNILAKINHNGKKQT